MLHDRPLFVSACYKSFICTCGTIDVGMICTDFGTDYFIYHLVWMFVTNFLRSMLNAICSNIWMLFMWKSKDSFNESSSIGNVSQRTSRFLCSFLSSIYGNYYLHLHCSVFTIIFIHQLDRRVRVVCYNQVGVNVLQQFVNYFNMGINFILADVPHYKRVLKMK